MIKHFTHLLAISLLFSNPGNLSADCGKVSATITNLPASDTTVYQVNGLNSAGQLTGFYTSAAVPSGHAFLFSGAQLLDAGTLGGESSQGLAINNLGWIAGQSQLNGDLISHAMVFDGTTRFDLGSLGGSISSASAINDAGQVAGSSSVTNSAGADAGTEAFLYANGAMTSLGTLGGPYSTAFALNKTAAVVGESTLTNGNTHGFLFSNGALTDIGTLGSNYSSAFVLNDAGLVAGESTLTNGENHGFVFAAGVLTDVGTLGGAYSSAYLVNNSNQVAGLASTVSNAQFHGFLYRNGTMTDIGTLGGSSSTPIAMNNLGQIVGDSSTATGDAHAFLWNNGTMIDLNSLLSSNSGWVLSRAKFVNDAGRIVGFGNHNGSFDWFILDFAGSSNNPPVAVAGPNQTVDCRTQVTLDGTQSSDPDGGALTFEWTTAGVLLGTNSTYSGYFSAGTNVVTLRVTDPCGASAVATTLVIVQDTTSPVIHSVSVSPNELSPPNHRMVPVRVTVVAEDNCDSLPHCKIISITCNEQTSPAEIRITGKLTARLAATRDGGGRGRIYTIKVQCTDNAGNCSTRTVTVTVPQGNRKK